MHEAWELLTTFNDDEFAGFIEEALLVVAGVRALPELKEHHRWRRNEIDEACEKTKQFIEVCETLPVFLSAWEMMSFVRDSRATLGDYFPELLARAREAYLALLAEAANAKAERKDDIGDLSRKFGDGRQEMARDLTLLIRRITGQPHYEAIAALLNVILDTADHNMISADAVRKAVARGSDYSAA
jgi:hypothetical protein